MQKNKNQPILDALNHWKVAPPTPAPDLEQVLNIQPNSIQKQIFYLAKTKNWDGINKLIMSISDFNALKKLIALQLDIALLIANQIQFEAPESETRALTLPGSEALQKIAEANAKEKRKIKWLYTLLLSKKNLSEANSFDSLSPGIMEEVHTFLEVLGYLSKFTPINNLDDLKKALADNFKELFEKLFLVMAVQPKILSRLEQVKKETGLQ